VRAHSTISRLSGLSVCRLLVRSVRVFRVALPTLGRGHRGLDATHESPASVLLFVPYTLKISPVRAERRYTTATTAARQPQHSNMCDLCAAWSVPDAGGFLWTCPALPGQLVAPILYSVHYSVHYSAQFFSSFLPHRSASNSATSRPQWTAFLTCVVEPLANPPSELTVRAENA
jgi:hypothetical protein